MTLLSSSLINWNDGTSQLSEWDHELWWWRDETSCTVPRLSKPEVQERTCDSSQSRCASKHCLEVLRKPH